ncbi:olfactory receptor 10G2-like [Macrotis lagotis]|uniref:olfactory receptor 10G2-like n=1 Tax=Macrotis lagotis TaxID=92651 RepID=UPI003D68D29B
MEKVKNNSMETKMTDFILLGLSHPPNLRIFLFLIFLVIYIFTQLGNMLILITIWSDPQLHIRPMYILLGVLSFLDMWLSTVIVPRIIISFTPASKVIQFGECVAQLYSFHFLGSTQCFLYTLMAYDRYLAICRPLHYPVLMNGHLCTMLVTGAWLAGSIHGAIQATLTFRLPYCGPNQVDYFFCDIPAVTKLACTDTRIIEILIVSNSGLISVVCFILLVVSYAVILVLLRKQISSGRRKVLSTCAANLTVITFFLGHRIFIYSGSSTSLPEDKVVSVFFTAVTPLLNSIIYTLRNENMKNDLNKLTGRKEGKEDK